MLAVDGTRKERILGKAKRHTSHSWAALEQLVQLAGAAQIPLGGGAFGLASEVIQIFNSATANKLACKELLVTMSDYASTVWDFVQAITPEKLRDSEDAPATIARKAIADFQDHLANVLSIVDTHLKKSRLQRILLHARAREEIDLCKNRLLASHRRFQDSVANILIANTCRSSHSESLKNAKGLQIRIPGARSLEHDSIDIVDRIRCDSSSPSFWNEVSVAEVAEKKKLVKLYYDICGGEAAFLRDLQQLARNTRCNLPRVFGYCEDATPPFIVLTGECITPYQEHISEMSLVMTPDAATLSVWDMFIDIRDAARFLIDNNDCMDWQMIIAMLKDCRVDEGGKAILAPQWNDDEFADFEVEREELKHHLDQFLSLHAYTLRNCRLLNPLWYGLLGNSKLLLSNRPPLHDTSRAIGMLRECWPPSSERVRPWPEATADEQAPELGDIGVFVTGPGKTLSYKKLGNISQELGGVEVELEPIEGFDLVDDGVLRIEIAPSAATHLTEDETDLYDDHSASFASFNDEEEACDDASTWGPPSEYIESEEPLEGSEYNDSEVKWDVQTQAHSVDEFGCTWVQRFKDHHLQWTYFTQQATKLAKLYGVPPEELVFVTEKTWYLCCEAMSIDVYHDDPLYLFVHLDGGEGSTPRYYWTFSPEPLSRDESELEQLDMDELGCPEPIIDHEDPMYIQLDSTDIVHDLKD
ncbi:hypothetical protein FRB90_002813 [Tulasnella sp. 427]|nr:hypothetical protein FRB90_002813 [Tulasnella sp. 427]